VRGTVLEVLLARPDLADPEPVGGERLGHARAVRRGERDGEVPPVDGDRYAGVPECRRRRFEVVDSHDETDVVGTEDVLHTPRRHTPSAAQDGDRVAHLLHLGEQVARHEHRATLGSELAQELPHLAYARRIEPVRGFVEHEQFGITQERRTDAQPLTHAE
jgi:hypothetical protein